MKRAAIVWSWAAAIAVAFAQEPVSEPTIPLRPAIPTPRALLDDLPSKFGAELAQAPTVGREASVAERRAAAARWLDELFAPLDTPACRAVLAAFGHGAARPDSKTLAEQFPAGRPIAEAPQGTVILLPAQLEPITTEDAELLRETGMLSFEVALSGEWARYVGAVHAGPALADATLRLTRAARLEGLARLTATALLLQGRGVRPDLVGAQLLDADADGAGWPRAAVQEAASDPVARALVDTFFVDGPEWALVQYLRGGLPAILAGLERPSVTPRELLGAAPAALPAPMVSSCKLGPRGAAALVGAAPDRSWIRQIAAEESGPVGTAMVVRLLFENEEAATRAAGDLSTLSAPPSREISREGSLVTVRSTVAAPPKSPAKPATKSPAPRRPRS